MADRKIATRKIVSAALSGVARFRIYTLPNRHHRALACSITTVELPGKLSGVPPYGAEFELDYWSRSFSWKSHAIIVVAGFSIFQLIGIRIKSILEYFGNSSLGRPEEAGIRIPASGEYQEMGKAGFESVWKQKGRSLKSGNMGLQ